MFLVDDNLKESNNAAWLEASSLILIVLFFHNLYYLLAANLAATRLIDYGTMIQIPLDRMFPLISGFIIPYIFTWAYPVFTCVYLVHKIMPRQKSSLRHIGITLLALVFVNFSFYIMFPTHYPYRVAVDSLQTGGILERLIAYIYIHVPSYNATPSTHVSFPWLIYRMFKFYLPRDKALMIYRILFITTVCSVVAIKIHFFFDIISGILVAEFVYQFIFKRLEKHSLLINIPSKNFACYLSIAVVCMISGYFALARMI